MEDGDVDCAPAEPPDSRKQKYPDYHEFPETQILKEMK
jgi:hypothetical protein